MNRLPGFVSSALGVLLVALSPPSARAAEDLVSAWRSAQTHDAEFAGAQAQWQAGQTKQRQSHALFSPQVAVTSSLSGINMDRDTRGAQFSAPGFGSANDAQFRSRINAGAASNLALVARKPLYNAELQANASQLERQASLAEVQFRSAQQGLMLRTAQAYFSVLLAEDTLASLQAQKKAAARALEVADESFEAGALPVTDREEARARHDEIASQELAAGDDLRLKRSMLADLTGLAADRLRKLDPKAALDRYSVGPLEQWTQRAEQNNLLLAMQRLGHDIARDEVAKYRALVSPSLDFVAQLADERMGGHNGFGTTRITSTATTVGLQLTIPLVTGGMRSAKYDEAMALAEKARYDVEALRREVLRQTQAAWLGVTTGIAQVRAREQALRSASTRLEATETGQEVGARTMLDLVNAQADFFRAQLSLSQSIHQLLLGWLRLAASSGELSENELAAVNAVLAP
jgi:outer membrane protein